ncbi:hypothetical protein HDA40_001858 [Hamadaea flava]|uniref:Uncharacterized protein n=1 Tax=Hamadaea flava TaxID=1742688 RepID=A0ABV8LSG2_9ACTN|nr:hypothetical protein [Hamadaea flava]MCP2323351.1 hypothetical protein [Hamadaea flava]
MGYFGSILLTRSSTRAALLPYIDRIGVQHRHLRELRDGWQILETSNLISDPPDLVAALQDLTIAWNAPALAAYVNDGDCAQVHWSLPGTPVSSVHLPQPASTDDCGYMHRPANILTRAAADVAGDLTTWAAVCGLPVAQRRLVRTIGYDYQEGEYLSTDDQVFELIRSLGFADIPVSRPYTVDPYAQPFDVVTLNMIGLAFRAHSQAAARRQGYAELAGPEQSWEAEAIRLSADVFAAAFADEADLQALAERALWVQTAETAAREGTAPPPREAEPGVTNTIRLAADLAASQLAMHRRRPSVFDRDYHAGTGKWPELTGDQA